MASHSSRASSLPSTRPSRAQSKRYFDILNGVAILPRPRLVKEKQSESDGGGGGVGAVIGEQAETGQLTALENSLSATAYLPEFKPRISAVLARHFDT